MIDPSRVRHLKGLGFSPTECDAICTAADMVGIDDDAMASYALPPGSLAHITADALFAEWLGTHRRVVGIMVRETDSASRSASLQKALQRLAATRHREDPELDELLAHALGWGTASFGDVLFVCREMGKAWEILPQLTATIERAIEAVPRDCAWSLLQLHPSEVICGSVHPPAEFPTSDTEAYGHTPALALWGAILKDRLRRLAAKPEDAA